MTRLHEKTTGSICFVKANVADAPFNGRIHKVAKEERYNNRAVLRGVSNQITQIDLYRIPYKTQNSFLERLWSDDYLSDDSQVFIFDRAHLAGILLVSRNFFYVMNEPCIIS